jgi:hypothetical protein
LTDWAQFHGTLSGFLPTALWVFIYFFSRISNFFDLSITEKTQVVEMRILCIQIVNVLVLPLKFYEQLSVYRLKVKETKLSKYLRNCYRGILFRNSVSSLHSSVWIYVDRDWYSWHGNMVSNPIPLQRYKHVLDTEMLNQITCSYKSRGKLHIYQVLVYRCTKERRNPGKTYTHVSNNVSYTYSGKPQNGFYTRFSWKRNYSYSISNVKKKFKGSRPLKSLLNNWLLSCLVRLHMRPKLTFYWFVTDHIGTVTLH